MPEHEHVGVREPGGAAGVPPPRVTGLVHHGEPEAAEVGGIRLAVVHETGDRRGREARCAARFPDADLLVFGHSHIPWDTTADTGLRLVNPGSPTDRRRQPHGTFVTAVADDGVLRDVTFHPVVR